MVEEIQTLANFINNDYPTIQSMLENPTSPLSSDTKQIITNEIVAYHVNDVNTHLACIAIRRASDSESIFEEMRRASMKYLKMQETRINKILD